MKHLMLLLFISLFATSIMAQEKDGIYYSSQPAVKKHRATTVSSVDTIVFNDMDVQTQLQYQLDYVRHCLYKSNREKSYGYAFSIVGGLVMGIGLANDSEQVSEVYGAPHNNNFGGTDMLTLAGGIMSLAGTIMIIDSEKWLKRAYIGPNGVGVKFDF